MFYCHVKKTKVNCAIAPKLRKRRKSRCCANIRFVIAYIIWISGLIYFYLQRNLHKALWKRLWGRTFCCLKYWICSATATDVKLQYIDWLILNSFHDSTITAWYLPYCPLGKPLVSYRCPSRSPLLVPSVRSYLGWRRRSRKDWFEASSYPF